MVSDLVGTRTSIFEVPETRKNLEHFRRKYKLVVKAFGADPSRLMQNTPSVPSFVSLGFSSLNQVLLTQTVSHSIQQSLGTQKVPCVIRTRLCGDSELKKT